MNSSHGWRLGIVAAYLVAIFVLSSIPGRDLARLGLPVTLWNFAHIPLFVGLTVISLWAFVGKGELVAFLVCCACLAFSATDEWHQRFVPGRVASLIDLRANALGILIGLALWEAARPLAEVWRGEPQQ